MPRARGDANLFSDLRDIKRRVAVLERRAGGGGVSDHGGLTGLTDDDHTQYLLRSLADAKGDLFVASAADTVIRLPAPADGSLWVADSSQSSGWLAAAKATTTELADIAEAEAAGTTGTWPDGGHVHKIAAGIVAASKIKAEAWTSYVPSWTGASTNPAIGNGTLAGYHIQLGKTLILRIRMTAGSTTTFGSGVWNFGLPGGLSTINNGEQLVLAQARDAGVARHAGASRILGNSGVWDIFTAGSGTQWQSNQPFTWGNGDEFFSFMIVELA